MAIHRIKRPRLPDAYQEVEYIETVGNSVSNFSYIDTGVNLSECSSTIKLEFTYEIPSMQQYGDYRFGGAVDATNSNYFNVGIRNSKYNCSVYDGYNYVDNATGEKKYIELYANKNDITNTFIKIGDTTYTSDSWSYTPTEIVLPNMNIYLCAVNTGGSITGITSGLRLYDCYFHYWKNNSSYNKQYIPCYRKSDNVSGFYDFSGKVFLCSPNGVNFNIGPNKNTYVSMNNLNYGSNSVHLAKYGNDCIWQDEYEVTVEHEKESLLYTYINSYSLTSTAYPCQNGCMTTSKTGESITGSISANFGFRNTATFSIVSYDGADTSSTSWNISSITAPVVAGNTNTTIDITNSNSFVVTCYYGTSSGATTYSTSISANSTTTISGLTSGTTYYFFFRANRTGTITYKQRKSRINGGAYQKNPSISFVVNGDTTIELESATITSTESTSGTISSSVTSGVPSSQSWHTIYTGSLNWTPSRSTSFTTSTYSMTLPSGCPSGAKCRMTGHIYNDSSYSWTLAESYSKTVSATHYEWKEMYTTSSGLTMQTYLSNIISNYRKLVINRIDAYY